MYFRLNTLQHNTFGIFTNVTLFIKSIIMSFKLFYKDQFHIILNIYSVTHCRVLSNLKHPNFTLWLKIYSLRAHDYSP